MAEYRRPLDILWDFTLPEADRIQAAEALYNTGGTKLAITFAELLKLDRSPKMRMAAVKALGKVTPVSPPDIHFVKLLKKINLYDCDATLRTEAQVALDNIRQRCESLRGQTVRKPLDKKSDNIASKSSNPKPDWSKLIDPDLVRDGLKGPG